MRIIEQRIDNPSAGPNLLITKVAGIEALARSLVMNASCSTKEELRASNKTFRHRKPKTLIADYLKLKGKSKPAEYFGAETWRLFLNAVEYRNLLAHECTYLATYKYSPLEGACDEILDKLSTLARLRRRAT